MKSVNFTKLMPKQLSAVLVLCMSVFAFQGLNAQTYNGTTGLIPTVGTSGLATFTADATGQAGTVGTDVFITNIALDISHTWLGDLEMTLIAPDGVTSIDLGSDLINNGNGDDMIVNITDAAANSIASQTTCNGPNPPCLIGDWQAEGGLLNTVFNGVTASGVWTLDINDDAGGDSGAMNAWSMTFASADCEITCPGDVTADNDPGVCEAFVNIADPTLAGNCSGAPTGPFTTLSSGTVGLLYDGLGLIATDLVVTGATSDAVGDVNFTFFVIADIGGAGFEQAPLFGPDGSQVMTNGVSAGDCNTAGGTSTATVPSATWNSWVTTFGSSLTFTYGPDPDIDNICATQTAELTVEYQTMFIDYVNDYNGGQNASDVYPVGTTEVCYITADGLTGLPVSCCFDVTVNDTEAPTFTSCPSDIVIDLNPGECTQIVNYNVEAEDNCPATAVSFNQSLTWPAPNDIQLTCTAVAPADPLEYLRVFDLPSLGITGPINFQSIDLGVWFADGSEAFTVNVYELTGADLVPTNAELVLLGSTQYFPPAPLSVEYINIPSNPITIPAGTRIVVGVDAAGFNTPLGGASIAFDLAGETDPTYVRGCDVSIPGLFPDCTNLNNVGIGGNQRGMNLQINLANAGVDVVQVDASGLTSGDEFPIGTTTQTWEATDEAGNVSVCEFDITVNEFPNAVETLACNDNVQVSLDATGCATIGADMILEGGPYGCYDDYIVSIAGGDDVVCCSDIGGPWVTTVTDPETGNKCWGSIIVEDKLAPTIECEDIEIPCTLDPLDIEYDVVQSGTSTLELGAQAPYDASSMDFDFAVSAPPTATFTGGDVALDISHTWVGDLAVTLISPDGTSISIFASQCGTADDVDAYFADANPNPFACGGGTPVVDGDLQPQQPFANLIGVPAAGTWTLRIADNAGGDPTNINSATVNISWSGAYPGPVANDNCELEPLTFVDSDPGASDCDGNSGEVIRTWTAVDASGNSASCQQVITIIHPSLADVELPPHYDDIDAPALDCSGNTWDTNGNGYPDPEETGFPTIGGAPWQNGDLCNMTYSYEDTEIEICEGSFKVFREWLVIDWCTGESVEYDQLIKVLDTNGPSVDCPEGPVTIDVYSSQGNTGGPHAICTGNVVIPAIPVLGDDCSSLDPDNYVTELWTLGAGELLQSISGNGGIFFDVELIADNPPTNNAEYTVRHVIYDNCGNLTECIYDIIVVDKVPPVAICDEITEIALTNNNDDGCTLLPAEDLDDGSYDNCDDVYFYAAKMNPFLQPPYFYQYYPALEFCCDEAGTQVMVIVLVLDFNPEAAGLTLPDGSVFLLPNQPAFDGSFNTCMVEVNVEDKLPPIVSCPADVEISCDEYLEELDAAIQAEDYSLLDQFGDPIFFDNCDPIDTYTVGVNINSCAEGTITRTWEVTDASGNGPVSCTQTITVFHVSDWVVEFPDDIDAVCTDGDLPEFGEPAIFHDECELVGTSYEDQYFYIVPDACYKIVRTWTAINWCIYEDYGYDVWEEDGFAECDLFMDWDGDGDRDCRTFRDGWNESGTPGTPDGYIDYVQTIKVVDVEEPTFEIPEIDGCIVELDCDKDLVIPYPDITDVCSPSFEVDITGSFGVFNDVQGDITIDDVVPGTYNIYYTVTDNCGNQAYDDVTVVVEDCKKPTPYCKNGLVVELMQTGMVDVWASDLNDGSFDNCPGDLKYSFSSDVNDIGITFTCDDLGQNDVEVWVTDATGNQDFCQTFIVIQDNMFSCNGVSVAGLIETENNDGVQDVNVDVNGGLFSQVTPNTGSYNFLDLASGGDYSITPMLDADHGNGVTTYDLVLISMHILGVQSLDTPYKMIAADANNSNSITTLDMVYIRRVILQIDDSFPNNTSWRFVDAAYSFPDANNPWAAIFPEVINYNNLTDDQLDTDFVGIKVGDVNGSAVANNLMTAQDRTFNGAFVLATQDRTVEAGETFTVDFTAKEAQLLGYQFTLNFDIAALELVELVDGVASEENFGMALVDEGAITASWNVSDARTLDGDVVFSIVFRATADAQLSDLLSINSRYTVAEAYNAQSELMDVEFVLEGASATANFELYQNVPNPFKGATMIGFNLPEATTAKLTITDMSGKVLRVIEAEYEAGYNQVRVSDLPATGVLYYQLDTDNDSATRKMVILN